MLDLFTTRAPKVPKIPPNNLYLNLLGKFRSNLADATATHRDITAKAPSTDIIVRILKTVSNPLSSDVFSYLDNSKSTAAATARLMGITDGRSKPKLQYNAVCNNEISVWTQGTPETDLHGMISNSQTLHTTSAVRVVYTDSSDVNLNLPGKYTNLHPVRSWYDIDITRLLLQYRSYVMQRGVEVATPEEFVRSIVYINMLEQLLDHGLANLGMNSHTGDPIERFKLSYPGMTRDLVGKHNRISQKHLGRADYTAGYASVANSVITTKTYSLDMYAYPTGLLYSDHTRLIQALFSSYLLVKLVRLSSSKVVKFDRARIVQYLEFIKKTGYTNKGMQSLGGDLYLDLEMNLQELKEAW